MTLLIYSLMKKLLCTFLILTFAFVFVAAQEAAVVPESEQQADTMQENKSKEKEKEIKKDGPSVCSPQQPSPLTTDSRPALSAMSIITEMAAPTPIPCTKSVGKPPTSRPVSGCVRIWHTTRSI